LTSLWGRPLMGIALISLGALLLWPIFGAMLALVAYSLSLVALLLHHLSNLSHLYRWVSAPTPRPPEVTGAWEEVFANLARMVRRQTQIESRLSAALTRFQQAGEALPEGVVVLDEGDRIEWCNPRAEQYFGLNNQSDRGQQVTNLIRHPQFVQYVDAGRFNEPLVLRLTRRETELVLSVQLVPYGDREKLLLSRDITRWERLETTRVRRDGSAVDVQRMYPPYISVRSSPIVRMVAFTIAPPPLEEPPRRTSSVFAASLSDGISICRRSSSSSLPRGGGPSSRPRRVTAIASFRVDAAGNVARAFHAAPAPVARFST